MQVSRGLRSHTFDDAESKTDLRREYVDEAELIHEDVFDELRRIFPDVLQLQRLLLLDIIREWDGWAHIKALLDSSQEHDLKRVHVEDFVHRFIRRCQTNCVYEDFPSDDERRKVLKEEGYDIRSATGHGCNSLIDSLLQLLLTLNVINGPPADAKAPLWRIEACELARQHLCDHSDVGLHPRQRSEAGEVVDVAAGVHARAFLEHHKHASAIVSFLVQRFGLQNPSYVRPFRVVVFSRFDGASSNSIDEGIDIIFRGGEDIPPQGLVLYCNSGASITGLHYDPMVLRQSGRASKRQNRGKTGVQLKEPLVSGGVRRQRKQQVDDEVDPHDEVPTFMRVVSNRSGVLMSGGIGRQCSEERGKAAVESGDVALNEVNADADNMFYEVSAMDEWDTPDILRKKMQEALDDLSLLFRDHPTLPGDPANPKEEFSSSASTETALLLPSKHCAFKGCSWCGTDAASQMDHLFEVHEKALRPAMMWLQHLRPNETKDSRVLAFSVYNEAIAIAVRQGAPLASYSIDRRCLKD